MKTFQICKLIPLPFSISVATMKVCLLQCLGPRSGKTVVSGLGYLWMSGCGGYWSTDVEASPATHRTTAKVLDPCASSLGPSCSAIRTIGCWHRRSTCFLKDKSSSVGVWWQRKKKGNRGKRFRRVMPLMEQQRGAAADSKARRERRLLLECISASWSMDTPINISRPDQLSHDAPNIQDAWRMSPNLI